MKTLDVRGIACPEPIVRAKRALVDEGAPAVMLLVDSDVTRDNLGKFAAAKGFTFSAAAKGDQWEITITRHEGAPARAASPDEPTAIRPPVVLCKTKYFGTKSGELGTILIRAFFKTLLDLDTKPAKVIFVNEGVDLPCFDEQIIDDCRRLEELGAEIMSCGTCLDYFDLLGKQQVGHVGNMYDIAASLLEAGHVVEP